MSSGIADEGMRRFGKDRPTPLPVQALDHATGHILAAAALRGLTGVRTGKAASTARVSLARTATLLAGAASREPAGSLTQPDAGDYDESIEVTAWGPARRLRPPLAIDGAAMRWTSAAAALGSSPPKW